MNSSETNFICQPNCGACCIAPSITSKIPDMDNRKPSGVPCIHLDEQFACKIFNHPKRPSVCSEFSPSVELCGAGRAKALSQLILLEKQTEPF